MKFYRIRHSIDDKVVGCYPQLANGYYPVDAFDPRLLLNIFYIKVNEVEVFPPVPELAKKAKITDFMPGTATGWIISDRLKKLILDTNPIGIQFIKQKIIVKNEELSNYWHTNNYQFDFSVLDFSLTEISIMENTWDEDYRLKVNNEQDLLSLIADTKLPQSIKIFKPIFKPDYPKDFFALRYVYNGFSFFCSERFREKLEAEKITGIRYMELDEVL